MNAQSNWGISSDYTYDIIGEQVSLHDEWNRLTFGVDYSKGRDNVLRAAGFDVMGIRSKQTTGMKIILLYTGRLEFPATVVSFRRPAA